MKVIRVLAAVLLILALSIFFLVRNIGSGLGAMSVQNGNWVTNVSTGSTDAGIMLKATIAIGGLLASTRENSMYYRLNSVDGQALRLNCRYRVDGNDYDADWWSITAYGWDNFLIPNPQKRYSFNNENILRSPDGSWVIYVAAEEQAANWLPVGPSGAPSWRKRSGHDFDLLLRLYTPGKAYLERPHSAPLPRVILESCS
ncbi:DUF1214 domain-containing protein [Zhongshania sp.]|jgi:hypothetical protein|uniref:DUF1214 domain-containing protein n=1 Tax=Zhongshania sp. TaxID=1971902 RepID=UPI002A838E80|nr:DUF1214 domain-containing protein [Zhongshania sp.]